MPSDPTDTAPNGDQDRITTTAAMTQSRLYTVPVTLRVAQAFIEEHHRHHDPTTGHKVSTGVVDEAGELRGVAVMEYPKARMIDRQQVAEVTRVATDGCSNACSALYGATCRLQRAHGFAICITYTLLDEPGTSLRAAGWRPVAVTKGGKWTRISRVRADKLTGPKIRWECSCSSRPAIDLCRNPSGDDRMTVSWVLILTFGGLCLVMPLAALATWVRDWTATRNRVAPPELSICVGCGVHLNSRDESRAHFEGPSCLTT